MSPAPTLAPTPSEPPVALGTETRPPRRTAPGIDATRAVLAAVFGSVSERRFAVRFWDGTVDAPVKRPEFTMLLVRPGALRRMLLPPSELSFAHAYMFGDVEYEGDLEAVIGVMLAVAKRGVPEGGLLNIMGLLRALPRESVAADVAEASSGRQLHRGRWAGGRNTPGRDAAAVRFHYDVGNDFFALWLGRRMVYTCGYFETGAEDIDTAQEAKLDLVCRKLRLAPGERMLDIGCGWGGLVQYAVEHYGVEAVGITLSVEQAKLAQARITEAGLGSRCRIELRDYREFTDRVPFDKISCIGMSEHVGRARLPQFFGVAHRVLRPGGLFLNQAIVTLGGARAQPKTLSSRLARFVWQQGGGFSDTYVWPDVRLVTNGDLLMEAEAAGFETRDVESLREHYPVTLRRWLTLLDERHEDVVRVAGEPTYRVWRLHLAGAAHRFASGQISVGQTVFAKPDPSHPDTGPSTRAHLYLEK